MKIILSGGGSGTDSEEIDEYFASLVNKEKIFVYIPLAIDNYRHPYESCIRFIHSTFDKYGIDKYKMITEDNINELSSVNLSTIGGIYIGGGNTAYLLKTLKESGAWRIIKEAIGLNIPIYGGSAGAIILSKDISTSFPSDGNFVNLKDISGMDVLNGKSIWCHYKNEKKEKILCYLHENKINDIILLSEKTGLYVSNDKIEVIGKEPAIRLKNKNEFTIAPNKLIN